MVHPQGFLWEEWCLSINVLFTGGRAPSTLELARLFFTNGHRVHVADSFPYSITKKSSCIDKFHLTRKPKQETEEFIKDLLHIIEKENIDLLIPTCEEIFYIAKFQEDIKKHCEVLVDDFEKLLTLHHKYKFIKLAESFGLQVPQTSLITSLEEWNEWIHGDQRFIAKPVFSRFSNELLYYPEDRHKKIDVRYGKQWVLQKFIEGRQYCSYSVAKKGKVLAQTIYESEFRAGDGASIYFQHTQHDKIEEWVNCFVSQTEFNGQIAFDFIENRKGQIFAIECNPRLTSGVHLFRDTSFPSVFIEGVPVLPNACQPASIKAAMILYGVQNMKVSGWKRYFQVLKASQDVVFDPNDKRPFFHQWYSYYKIYELSKKNKISLLEATTYDISWDGDQT